MYKLLYLYKYIGIELQTRTVLIVLLLLINLVCGSMPEMVIKANTDICTFTVNRYTINTKFVHIRFFFSNLNV